MTIDVVFPCLDEAQALPLVLSRLPEGYRAIVVDNGSTDGSAAIAKSLGAHVIDEPVRGFGSACAAGVAASTAELIAFCDADASMDPRDLVTLAARMEADGLDLVLGRRRVSRGGAWPLHARLANVALALLLRRATGYSLSDLGPMRIMNRAALVDLDLQDRRSGYPLELVLAAKNAGWRVAESDVGYSPRVGKSKVTGTLRGTMTAILDMSRLLRRHDSVVPQAVTL